MECSQYDNCSGESGSCSMFAGAIFMSNCSTRRECFQRKLFGLPSSRANLVKNVKTGMILFLFDHEERKLYGVFEATSDGSMNIEPDAFLSSGMSYPAQVQIKIIWKCMPLLEKEFRHAIKENYYTPVKFKFDLSYEQVSKLIRLFSTKKIGSPRRSPRMLKKQKKQYEKSNLAKTRAIGKGHSVKSDTSEPSRTDHTIISRYASTYRCNVNPSKCLGNSPTSEDLMVDSQLKSDQTAVLDWKPNSMPLTPQNDSASRGSFPVSSSYGCPENRIAPCTGIEWPSTALEVNYPSLGKKLASYTRSAVEFQAPCLGSHSYASQNDPEATKLHSADYSSLDVSSDHEIRGGSSVPLYEPSRASLSFSGSEGYTYIKDPYHNSFRECYDPSTPQIFLSTPGIVVTRGTDTLSSVLDARNSREAHQEEESPGQRYWHWDHSPDYFPLSENENLGKNVEASQIFISPHEDAFNMKYSYSLDDWDYCDYEGKRTNHFVHTNVNCANSATSSLFSDEYQRRTSVFSRLSGFEDDHQQQNEAGESEIYELLALLSKRTKQWNKKTKVHKQEIFWDVGKQSGHMSEMGTKEAGWVVDSKSNVEAAVDENRTFLNFKRRSDARKVQNDANEEKHKKRRLIRPSFSEEDTLSKGNCESHCMLRSSQATVGCQHLVINDEATRNAHVGESLVEALKMQETLTRQDVGSSNECTDIVNTTVQKCGNEMHNNKVPAFRQISIIQGEGSGTVELLMDLQGCLSDEKATSHGDNGSAAVIMSPPKLPIVDSKCRGKVEKFSVVCNEIPVNLVDLCNQIGQKDVILSGGGGKMLSLEPDVDCCHTLLGHIKGEEVKEAAKFHVVGDESSVFPPRGLCEGKLNEAAEENLIVSHESLDYISLESDVKDVQEMTIITEAENKEHTYLATSNEGPVLSIDIRIGSDNFDEFSGKKLVQT